MSKTNPNVFRKIAENELAGCFGDLTPATKQELATSLVRQWITYKGTAFLITPERQFQFRLTRRADGMAQVARTVKGNPFSQQLLRAGVIEDEIPKLVHELSVRQCTHCRTRDGKALLLRVEPAKAKCYIERVLDEEG